MEYTLTITLPLSTDFEPSYAADGRISGFIVPESKGGGRISPWVCFEVVDSNIIPNETNLCNTHDIQNFGINVYELAGFDRELTLTFK